MWRKGEIPETENMKIDTGIKNTGNMDEYFKLKVPLETSHFINIYFFFPGKGDNICKWRYFRG